jgi:hypothetical protein
MNLFNYLSNFANQDIPGAEYALVIAFGEDQKPLSTNWTNCSAAPAP